MNGEKPSNGQKKTGPANKNFDPDFGWKHDRYQPFDQAYKNQRNPNNSRYNQKVRTNGTYSENNDWAHDKFVDLEREFNVKKNFKRKRRPDQPFTQDQNPPKNPHFNGKLDSTQYYSNHSKNTDPPFYSDSQTTPDRETTHRKGSGNSANTSKNCPEPNFHAQNLQKTDLIVDLCIIIDGTENRIDINLNKVYPNPLTPTINPNQ
jgi:hypothetical protein